MKTCPNCSTEIEHNFEVCWNCCYSLTEKRVIDSPENGRIDFEKELNKPRTIDCLRCGTKLTCTGVNRFHEGPRWGILGDFFELFVNKVSFEVYMCFKCGKVEFFIPLDDLSMHRQLSGVPVDVQRNGFANLIYKKQQPQ